MSEEVSAPQGQVPSEQPQQTQQPTPQRYKVKIDGAEQEVGLEDLITGYQLRQVSDKRLNEVAKEKKRMAELIQSLKSDETSLNSFLKDIVGVDPDEWAEKRTLSRLEYDSLSEKDRELYDLKRWKEQKERDEARQSEEQKKRQALELEEKIAQDIDSEIAETIKNAGVKPSVRLVKRIAEQMLASMESGDRLHAKDVVGRVSKELQDEALDFLESLEDGSLGERLPASLKDKLRKSLMQEVGTPFKGAAKTPTQQKSTIKKKLDIDEWINKKIKG